MSLVLLSLIACKTMPVEDGQKTGPIVTVDDGFVSAYMMPTDDGVVLFDTANDKKGKAMLAALEDAGFGAEDVTDIFITHGHVDHVKALHLYPDARVYALEAEEELIAEESHEGLTLTDVIEDGDIVEVGGLSVEVFAVPGHTAGSAVFLVDGVLVLGDVVAARKDGTLKGPPKFFSDDADESDASVRALADRLEQRGESIDWLLFSHSGPLQGIDPLLNY